MWGSGFGVWGLGSRVWGAGFSTSAPGKMSDAGPCTIIQIAYTNSNVRMLEGDERDFFIDNLQLRIHFIIEMIWWTGLAPWEFDLSFPGSLTSTFLFRERC